jgi:hypothetical protein
MVMVMAAHICNSYGIKFTQRTFIPYANWATPALAPA